MIRYWTLVVVTMQRYLVIVPVRFPTFGVLNDFANYFHSAGDVGSGTSERRSFLPVSAVNAKQAR
jgi:hypothetical protein